MNLLNSVQKKDKMLGKPRIVSLFPQLIFPKNSIKHEHSRKILYVLILIMHKWFTCSHTFCNNVSKNITEIMTKHNLKVLESNNRARVHLLLILSKKKIYFPQLV